jgi:hypothetical protein
MKSGSSQVGVDQQHPPIRLANEGLCEICSHKVLPSAGMLLVMSTFFNG